MSAPAAPFNPAFLESAGIVPYVAESCPDFEVIGDVSPVVHIVLKAGQEIQAEPGTMAYMSNDIKEKVKFGGFSRMLMDGTLMKAVFKNNGSDDGNIGLTSNVPGNLIPINLDSMGGKVLCKKDAFVAAMDPDCRIRLSVMKMASCFACCCADTPLFMQSIEAKGWVFLSGHGTLMQKYLNAGEELIIDGNSLLAAASTVTLDARTAGGCGMMCCGGEGAFNSAVKGPGLVVLCSLPMDKLRKLFVTPPSKTQKADGGADVGRSLA